MTPSTNTETNAGFLTVEARLLSCRSELDRFKDSPESYLAGFDLTKEDYRQLLCLDVSQIEYQANLLVEKRWNQIKHFLPASVSKSPLQMRSYFNHYAEGHWPTGHNRHFVDALHFSRYLKKHQLKALDRKEVFELEFAASSKRATIGIFKWKIVVFLRINKIVKQIAVGSLQ